MAVDRNGRVRVNSSNATVVNSVPVEKSLRNRAANASHDNVSRAAADTCNASDNIVDVMDCASVANRCCIRLAAI